MQLDRHSRDLVLYNVYADLKAEAARSYIGYLWWIIEPAATMVVFYLVFGVFLQRGGPDYAPFLLAGILPWKWLQSGVLMGSRSILLKAGMLRQVYVPKTLFPLVGVLGITVKFLVAFGLLLVFLWIWGLPPGPAYLALPVVLMVQLLLVLGLAALAASVVPFFPDLQYILDNFLLLVFFLSGIFYAGASLPTAVQPYFYLNPVAHLIEGYRAVLIAGVWPSWTGLGLVAALALLLLLTGWAILRRYDTMYPRLV